MVKKISALLLALVLCLSVVVLPASAVEITEAPTNGMAVTLEWDQESYMPGDEATLNVYVRVDEATDMLMTGYLVIAFDDYIDASASFTPSDLYESIYKDLNDNHTWMASTLYSKIQAANTAEENAIYTSNYLRLSLGKNTGGSHDNASNAKLGLPVSEINELEEPFFSVTVTVSADAPEGVKLNAAMPSGLASVTTYSTMNYRLNGTTKNVKMASYDYSAAVAEASIGAEVAASILNPLKGQIRFQKDGNGAYAGKFDVRALAVITGADFEATFGDIATAKANIKEAGFVFASGANVAAPSMDAVKALVENGTAAAGYSKKTVNYISTTIDAGNYVFSCIVTDATDNTQSLVAVGYIVYTNDAGDTVYAYYPAAQEISFAGLFNDYYDDAFPA
ncbi:MAG: hypothetical protein IKV25_00560 [Clostridia bacterium]|nr:hypothetical protein [Clostridia bacterium]